MKYIVVSCLLLLFIPVVFADQNTYLFEEANKLYQKEQYAQAIQKYEEVLANNYESWELYYNLGNAYYKDKQLGKAILNYERALRLNPKHEDILFNLELANLSVVDKINIPPDFFLFKIFSDFKNYFSLNLLTIVVIVSYVCLILFTIIRIFVGKRIIRQISAGSIFVMLIIFVLFASILGLRIHDKNNIKYGIIIVNKVDVKSSPEKNSTELFSLHEGLKMQVQKQVNNWYQIRLRDGKVGWVTKGVLEII